MRKLLIPLLLLISGIVHAIDFDAASRNWNDGTSVSVSHTASGSDRWAIIMVFQNTDHTISSVSYGAQTPALVVSNGRLHVYSLDDPATGAQTVSASSSASAGIVIGVVTYTGVSGIGTHQTATNNELASITSPTVTSETGGLVVDAVVMVNTTMSPDGGQTARLNIDSDTHGVGFFAFGMSEEPGATSVTTSWSTAESFGDNYLTAVPLTAAAGGGGLIVNPISGRGGAAAQPVIP